MYEGRCGGDDSEVLGHLWFFVHGFAMTIGLFLL